ncbi:MAG: NAD(P)H-hydrate dehydratase [Burkholderiales bacterium]
MTNPIRLTQEIRAIEEAAGALTPSLMERAATAAADLAVRLLGDRGKDVLVLAGPGNNGGDAKLVAGLLKARYCRVTLVTAADAVPAERRWDLVVDGLFGIGLTRPVEGAYANLVDLANRQACPRLALDVPSGLQSDTGRVLGRAVRATHTITFIALKPGLLTLDGPDHCGEVTLADLGLDAATMPAPGGWVAGPGLLHGLLRPRPRNFHKGMAGSVAIIGGAAGMSGAALLAARAALMLGAGRVYAGLLDEDAPRFDPTCPELMLRSPDDALGLDLNAIVVGPGIGTSDHAETLVGEVLAIGAPCVLDADALNLIAGNADLRAACMRRKADTLATPHPAEAARLLGMQTAAVQEDRLAAARRLSAELNAHVVLKGVGSVLVARDGHWFVNTSGNPGMASAGMGDVLSGILGALLAQKLSGEAALIAGTHLHGAAADLLAGEGIGPVGLTAGETIAAARRVWNGWLAAGSR